MPTYLHYFQLLMNIEDIIQLLVLFDWCKVFMHGMHMVCNARVNHDRFRRILLLKVDTTLVKQTTLLLQSWSMIFTVLFYLWLRFIAASHIFPLFVNLYCLSQTKLNWNVNSIELNSELQLTANNFDWTVDLVCFSI